MVAVTNAKGSHGPKNWGEKGREEFKFKSYFRSYVNDMVMDLVMDHSHLVTVAGRQARDKQQTRPQTS